MLHLPRLLASSFHPFSLSPFSLLPSPRSCRSPFPLLPSCFLFSDPHLHIYFYSASHTSRRGPFSSFAHHLFLSSSHRSSFRSSLPLSALNVYRDFIFLVARSSPAHPSRRPSITFPYLIPSRVDCVLPLAGPGYTLAPNTPTTIDFTRTAAHTHSRTPSRSCHNPSAARPPAQVRLARTAAHRKPASKAFSRGTNYSLIVTQSRIKPHKPSCHDGRLRGHALPR